MAQPTFPLTVRWFGAGSLWSAYCPEWAVEGQGSSKEEAKKMLCYNLYDAAVGILFYKNGESDEKKEAARNVLDNRYKLSELLREAT